MTKLDVLKLLRSLVEDAFILRSDPDDASGLNTEYFLDQDQLLSNIQTEIEKEEKSV